MNTYTLEVHHKGSCRRLTVPEDRTLLASLRQAGYAPAADCGGIGRCGKCLVTVTGPVTDGEGRRQLCREEAILSCRFRPAGDCLLWLPEGDGLHVVTGELEQIPARGEGLGAAVDIGTTTLAVMLYDLSDGRLLAARGERSAQRPFGADVISRIGYCAAEERGLARLQSVVARQITQLLELLCRQTGRDLSRLRRVAVAGNTVMEHIFTHLDPQSIGVAPFRPLSLFGRSYVAADLLPGLPEDCPVYLCPAVAGYVGGDISAGLLAAGAEEAEELTLFLDVGTNGEMALGDKNGWLCCAAAAGPAFEGAEMACGMGGEPGAIDRVWLEQGRICHHVIGEGPARGICGSGLIDAVAALLEAGLLLPSGRMEENGDASVRRVDGELRYYFTDRVYLSAADVRALQLAKAAIRAGLETLLELRGLRAEDIGQCLLAGGFGAYLNIESACTVGLLPPCLARRTRHIGNAAGMGAALTLDPGQQRRLEALAARCDYHELSGSPLFNDHYLDAMSFDGDEE